MGYAQFDWALRNDSRVKLFERTNIVELPSLGYDAAFDLAVCDVSFTSIENILGAVLCMLKPQGAFITLVKPQFEAEKAEVGEGGIVRSPAVRLKTLTHVAELWGLSPLVKVRFTEQREIPSICYMGKRAVSRQP